MATYAIGDIQGCLDELLSLLDLIGFSVENDKLWFAGDIVNRGPKSLETMRFIKSLGDNATTVLGNHDIHLLASAEINKSHRKDTFDEIFSAADRIELLDWLRHRALFHHDDDLNFSMVHAGLAPQWSIEQSLALANEVESILRSDEPSTYLAQIYGNTPTRWSDDLTSWERLRCITNYLTRVRFCDTSGQMNFSEKGAPGSQAEGLIPWYEVHDRQTKDHKIIFGHWSTHKLRVDNYTLGDNNVFPIDTGCLWGGELSALRLEDERIFQVSGQVLSYPLKEVPF